MADAQTIKTKIQGLIDKGNEATGGSDTDLTSVVNALISGFEQDGSNVLIKCGTLSPGSSRPSIIHDLGEVPDVFIIMTPTTTTGITKYLVTGVGFSKRFLAKYPTITRGVFITCNYGSADYMRIQTWSNDFSIEYGSANAPIYNANETKVEIGTSTYPANTSATYSWIAIGGLC